MLAVKYKNMVAMVLTIALRYIKVLKYISVPVGHKVANSLRLLRVHRSLILIFAVLKKPKLATRPCIKRQTRKVRIFFCLFNLCICKEVAFCIHWILFSKASSLASRNRSHTHTYLVFNKKNQNSK